MSPSIFLKEIDNSAIRIVGSVPRGFYPGKSTHQSKTSISSHTGLSSKKPFKSSDDRWTLGDRIFHDDHGYGSITQIMEGDEGPVVKVVFETGHEKRFLSLHQSSKFTKIGED